MSRTQKQPKQTEVTENEIKIRNKRARVYTIEDLEAKIADLVAARDKLFNARMKKSWEQSEKTGIRVTLAQSEEETRIRKDLRSTRTLYYLRKKELREE